MHYCEEALWKSVISEAVRLGEIMNIIYASNNEYAKYLGISMLSLFDNNRDLDKIAVYVLSQSIEPINIEYLYTIAKKYHREVNIIDISEFEKHIPFDFATSGFNSIVLSRLFLCSYLPSDIKRILYLDCDIIVKGSIKELETISFGQNLAAAVPELYMPADKKALIGLKKEETYYNAGVFLVNLTLWRLKDMESVFIEYYHSMNGRLLYNDQDILNHCCKGKIKTLSHTYNLSTNLYYFPRYFVKKIQPAYDTKSSVRYSQILSKPTIIHYMGDERPWIEGNHNRYREQYEYYCKRSPWGKEPLVHGKEFYMFCYHVLNLITIVCPWFRMLFSKIIGINRYKWFNKD